MTEDTAVVDMKDMLAKEFSSGNGKLIISESLSDLEVGMLVRDTAHLSDGVPFIVIPGNCGNWDRNMSQFLLLASDEKTLILENACKKINELGGPNIPVDVAGFLVGLILCQERKPFTSSADVQWLEISPRLLDIMSRAKSLRTVVELDQCIDDYRAQLNGIEDRYGNLNALFELRNGIVEFNRD